MNRFLKKGLFIFIIISCLTPSLVHAKTDDNIILKNIQKQLEKYSYEIIKDSKAKSFSYCKLNKNKSIYAHKYNYSNPNKSYNFGLYVYKTKDVKKEFKDKNKKIQNKKIQKEFNSYVEHNKNIEYEYRIFKEIYNGKINKNTYTIDSSTMLAKLPNNYFCVIVGNIDSGKNNIKILTEEQKYIISIIAAECKNTNNNLSKLSLLLIVASISIILCFVITIIKVLRKK